MEFNDLSAQYKAYKGEIDSRIQRVLEHAHFIMGPEIEELEYALARYVGVKHAISVASGTHSLEIALRALGIGPGDEVITVPFTWISSSEVIGLVGARPVFVDIDPGTFNIDARKIEAAITSKTRAILAVNLFGQMADYERINAIATQRGLAVIEDAAQSFGAQRHGVRSGAAALISSTSFFPAKTLGCYGDGGALFTNIDELNFKIRAIRTHGGIKRHQHTLLGMNARLDTIQAAVLLAKFPHFYDEVEARTRIGTRYSNLLRNSCIVPSVALGNTHVYAQYTIRVSNREELIGTLKAVGIPSAVYYPKCLHEQPVFNTLGYSLGDFPESERASREVISLPMHPFLSETDQDCIVKAVKQYAKI